MTLEINKQDQKADLKFLTSAKRKIKRTLFGVSTTLMLFSGCIPSMHVEANSSKEIESMLDTKDPASIIKIPEIYEYDVSDLCGKKEGEPITVADLEKIGANGEHIHFAVYDNSSLEWLNNCTNLKDLLLIIHTEGLKALEDIKSLPNLNSITLTTMSDATLTEKNSQFIKNSPNLQELHLIGGQIEPNLIEEQTNLKKLSICAEGTEKIDYKKLTFLEELNFTSKQPYDIAIHFTTEDYNTLIENGVNVTFETEEVKEKVLEINQRLDQTVAILNLAENSTDQEKLDAILIHVLDNLTYDEAVSEALQNSSSELDTLTETFYEGGDLYGALEKDSAICGNYAAYVEALAERVNLNTYILTSPTHAWNLVEVDNDYYYVDATFLDGSRVNSQKETKVYDENGNLKQINVSIETVLPQEKIKEKETDELVWYMEDPTDYPEEDSTSHQVDNMPSYIEIRPLHKDQPQTSETKEPQSQPETVTETEFQKEELPQKESELQKESETEQTAKEDMSSNKFEIIIGDKKWIIAGGAAIGILTALGAAVGVHHHKEKKRREIQQRNMDNYDTSYRTSYGDSWDNSSYGHKGSRR